MAPPDARSCDRLRFQGDSWPVGESYRASGLGGLYRVSRVGIAPWSAWFLAPPCFSLLGEFDSRDSAFEACAEHDRAFAARLG